MHLLFWGFVKEKPVNGIYLWLGHYCDRLLWRHAWYRWKLPLHQPGGATGVSLNSYQEWAILCGGQLSWNNAFYFLLSHTWNLEVPFSALSFDLTCLLPLSQITWENIGEIVLPFTNAAKTWSFLSCFFFFFFSSQHFWGLHIRIDVPGTCRKKI